MPPESAPRNPFNVKILQQCFPGLQRCSAGEVAAFPGGIKRGTAQWADSDLSVLEQGLHKTGQGLAFGPFRSHVLPQLSELLLQTLLQLRELTEAVLRSSNL